MYMYMCIYVFVYVYVLSIYSQRFFIYIFFFSTLLFDYRVLTRTVVSIAIRYQTPKQLETCYLVLLDNQDDGSLSPLWQACRPFGWRPVFLSRCVFVSCVCVCVCMYVISPLSPSLLPRHFH